jgi:hypothetical protein
MPAKTPRSTPRPSFELPKARVALRASLLSCWKARKTRILTPVRESSGEFRFKGGHVLMLHFAGNMVAGRHLNNDTSYCCNVFG